MKTAKEIILFVLFQLMFCTLLSIVLVFHGPFVNIKEMFVTTAMSTMNHKYLASMFVSQDEIDRILEKNKPEPLPEQEDPGEIIIKNPEPEEKDNANFKIIDFDYGKFKGHLMVVDDPSRVKVATTDSLGQRGTILSQIVKKYDAVGGINAGGFMGAVNVKTGGIPQGLLIENYEIKHQGSADNNFIIGFNRKNVLVTGSYTMNQIKKMGIRDAVSFGPTLIVNGKPTIKSGDGGKGIQPRTAIGQKKDGTVLLLVIDGRQVGSIGATLREVQDILLKYGAYNAANLDGGSSTTMYYDGSVVNRPSDILGERAIPSAFIVE